MKMDSKPLLFACVLWLFATPVVSGGKVVFSGGAPLDTHQPAVVIPLLSEALKRNGLSFEATFAPSKRSLMLSNGGVTDGELHRVFDFHAITRNEYPNLLRIESELMRVHRAIFSKKKMAVRGIEDLAGYSIAYQAGRKNIEAILTRLYPQSRIDAVTTDHQAFNMLLHDRVDVVISESFLGKQLISHNQEFEEIKEIHKAVGTPIYAYIHKKHASLREKIATSLEKMKRDGSFQRIAKLAEEKLLQP